MNEQLVEQYNDLLKRNGFEKDVETKRINVVIREALKEFVSACQKPAIYCYGYHTKMLMADFMYELKPVKIIIDNYVSRQDESGFKIIRDEEIEDEQIDGVIISSYKLKENIINDLRQKHPDIKYLDLYAAFEKKGIKLKSEYYANNHPYHFYNTINILQRKITGITNEFELLNLYKDIIAEYIYIKDFYSAIKWTKKVVAQDNSGYYKQLLFDLENLYQKELLACSKISEANVLMLCIDGLRRRDVSEVSMPKILEILESQTYMYEQAYSYSTSTYESLIPVYSENNDLRTQYFENNMIPQESCRFLSKALQQHRDVFFYTDMDEYISCDKIQKYGSCQTASEKIWSFVLDASCEKNGLFYVHILYESHYSFPNPYTERPLVAEGTAMLFDFLERKGGKLRTDYVQQHTDALHYLDDVLAPFLSRIQCRMLLYADHGNLLLEWNSSEQNVKDAQLICDEELIQIPYAIKSPEQGNGRNESLMTLMSLNDIVICLLEKKKYIAPNYSYVKIARSELYNPDFRFLYKKWGQEQKLLAFECFVFENGYKLVIYSNGKVELYREDQIVTDADSKVCMELIETVKASITVCDKIIEDNRVCE